MPDDAGALLRPFSVDDVHVMVRAGVLAEDERVELWEGRLVEMSPKHRRHEWIKDALNEHLVLTFRRRFHVSVETTIYLSESTFVEPDLCVRRPGLHSTDVRGPDLLLAIEVADTTYRTDMRAKPRLYAEHDAPLLWVVDARDGYAPVTHVHSQPTPTGYAEIVEVSDTDELSLPFAPEVRFSLREILSHDD